MATELCFEFARKGKCSKGQACTFAHGRQELRSMPQEEWVPRATNMQIACPISPIQTDTVLEMKALPATSNQLKQSERLALTQWKELEEIGLSGLLSPPGLLAPTLGHSGYMSLSLVAEQPTISACYEPRLEVTAVSQTPTLFWL